MDVIPTGLGSMTEAFLVFRGALLPASAFIQFTLVEGKKFYNQTRFRNGNIQTRNNWFEGLDMDTNLEGKSTWVEMRKEFENLAGFVNLRGAQSTSMSFKVALEFAMPGKLVDGMVPTLFVVCIHNWFGYQGFRLSSAFHSAHPYEQELLLIEGVNVAVIGNEDLLIDNSMTSLDPFWEPFNNRVISVVYLFHGFVDMSI